MGKVVRHSYGIAKDRDELDLNRRSYDDRKKREDAEYNKGVDARIAVKESAIPEENYMRNSLDRDVSARKAMNLGNVILEQGKLYLFKSLVSECFKGALWMDEEFVSENSQKFDELVSGYVDDRGGYSMLLNAVKANPKVTILKEMQRVCESSARATTMRIIREVTEDPKLAEFQVFEMDEEEKEELINNRAELSIDQLSQLVKDKVLTVVKDERDRQSREKELLDDLENQASEDSTVIESSLRFGESTVKEGTLFDSIFQNSLYDAAVAVQENISPHMQSGNDDDLTEPVMDDDDIPSSTSELVSPMARDVDLDLVMSEAITFYTLMETMHTISLETFKRDDIMNMSHKLLNRK